MSPLSNVGSLFRLAHLYGIQTAYYSVNHRRQQASPESILAILRSMGAPAESLLDVLPAWREKQQALWQRVVEPVIIDWDGEPPAIRLRLPMDEANANIKCNLKLETGEELHWEWHGVDSQALEIVSVEGRRYVAKQLLFPDELPWGYHHLVLELSRRQEKSVVISSPRKTYTPPAELEERTFGVFLPLYALHSGRSWGSGDFSDLKTLVSWLAGIGGQVLATLPLLPTFLDELSGHSPYLPITRLLWNEFYLDINAVTELRECPSALALLESSLFQDEINALRTSPLVDYHQETALKRKVLGELCRHLFSEASDRLKELHKFVEENPLTEAYARFCATCEKRSGPWRFWPNPLLEGNLAEGDYDENEKRYHLYVQWLANQQIEAVSTRAREKGVKLYLDFPLGVHPDGFDTWCERESFISGVSVGAPPDAVFTRGQNWEFLPPHPDRIREQGYRYVIACLRHHLRHAEVLRIDHVMGLHRLFCIPKGMEAGQGAYVRYYAKEMYAILALESHRHKAVIVGEDLGTVPSYVRPAMKKHDLQRTYVLQYELASDLEKRPPPAPLNAVASLNTHDIPPFASFWQGLDIRHREKLGFLDGSEVKQERNNLRIMKQSLVDFLRLKGWLRGEAGDVAAVLKACLSFLAASPARLVLINLEDLWHETEPQNVPSTNTAYPNWRRKAKYTLEQFCKMPSVVDTLMITSKLRKQSRQRR